MAQIKFETGDCFTFETGYGICLEHGRVLLITGKGGRTGWIVTTGELPKSARLQEGEHGVPDEITLAFRSIKEVLKDFRVLIF